MPYTKNALIEKVADRISALYQMGLISKGEKNDMARHLYKAVERDFGDLYDFIENFNKTHPLIEEIQNWIEGDYYAT